MNSYIHEYCICTYITRNCPYEFSYRYYSTVFMLYEKFYHYNQSGINWRSLNLNIDRKNTSLADFLIAEYMSVYTFQCSLRSRLRLDLVNLVTCTVYFIFSFYN